MTSDQFTFENRAARPAILRHLAQMFTRLKGQKTASNPAHASAHLRVPMKDLQRLAETAPHLLEDIGVPLDTEAHDAPLWRSSGSRHLLVRPPV